MWELDRNTLDSLAEGRQRVCLVTSEFHGLFKNGGIGTANTGLALELAARGHDVVVAYVDPAAWDGAIRPQDVAGVKAHYAGLGVRLEFVRRHPRLASGADDLGSSYSVYSYLEANAFDIVFFNECGGQGFFALTAKHTGMFRDPPRMFVVTHGPNEWVHDLNAQLYWGGRAVATSHLERRSVELADAVISPSRYLVEWMRSRDWKLPRRVHVIQNILPPAPGDLTPPAPDAPIREIVFFGRQETRKGLPIFCEALTLLGDARDLSRLIVTFLGKFSRVDSLHSGVYILEKTLGWKTHPKIIANFDQAQALQYLSKPGTLAVIPSVAENSPCVVAECIAAGIPFIATSTGGTAELLAESDRTRCLFEPTAKALAAKLREALDGAYRPAKLAVPPAETKASYHRLLEAAADAEPAAPRPFSPRVSVCLVGEDPSALTALAGRLRTQSYEAFDIIVVTHGGEPCVESAPLMRGLHAPALTRAEARNRAAAEATGDWLLFLDEAAVVLRTEGLAALVAVQQCTGAEIVAGVPLEYSRMTLNPDESWDGEFSSFPLGGAKELSLFENCLCRGIFLMKRDRFHQLGGFERDVDRAIEDRVLLTRALLEGATLEIAPRPVYWLRVMEPRLETVDDQRRILRAYESQPIRIVASALEGLLAAGVQGRERAIAQLGHLEAPTRDLALKMTFAATPTGTETFKPFVEYCLRRGRFAEALDFAALADPVALLPIAESAARAAAEGSAKRATREIRGPETIKIDLTADVAQRARSVTALPEQEITRGPGTIAAFAPPYGITILKAPAVCPPGTQRVEVEIGVDGAERSATEFSVCVCAPGARMRFADDQLITPEDAMWSDWRPIATARVELTLTKASEGPLDVFLISRRAGDVFTGERIAWRRLLAEITTAESTTASLIAPDQSETLLPFRLLREAELLTDASDFSYIYFLPGYPAMHHPLVGRAAVVRIRDAIFPGATGARAVFSIDNDQSRPVQFGFWIRSSSEPVDNVEALTNSAGFSGWTTARVPYQLLQASIVLPSPVKATMDLYLATRVVEFPDVNSCHAYWREILVVEKLAMAKG